MNNQKIMGRVSKTRKSKKNYKFETIKPKKLLLIGLLLAVPLFFIYIQLARAFQVDPLPSDNLIQNPWFRKTSDPKRAGFDGWTDTHNGGTSWTLSQKKSNPSPDMFVSGRCGNVPEFCGTAAKLSADDGKGEVGVDSYLYQVVSTNPENKKLKYFMHWVTHNINPLEVTVYGGETSDGPWIETWVPFYQVADDGGFGGDDTSELWKEQTALTPPVETVVPVGFPYYKVEIRANLPTPDGLKLTGVYFTAVPEIDPTATPTPEPEPTDPDAPTPTPTPTPNPLGVHIGDLDGWGFRTDSSGTWKAQVMAETEDVNNLPIEGVLVSGVWNAGVAVSNSCTTDSTGKCSVYVEQLPKTPNTVSFTVTNVSLDGYDYVSSLNHDPDGDSDGTSIIVTK
jgi:hypothetical protein